MKVFVYGTLRKGFSNHGVLSEESAFIKEALTKEKYTLSASGIPYLWESPKHSRVFGEVYEIPEVDILGLDWFEGGYTRKLIPLLDGTEAYAYFAGDAYKGHGELILSGNYADYSL